MYIGHSKTTPVITIACNRAERLLCSKVHVRTAAALMRRVVVLQRCYNSFDSQESIAFEASSVV